MTVKGFIITLDRAAERRSQVERLRAMCPVPCELVQAVDGGLLTEDQRRAVVRRRLFRPRYPFELRPGEIGIFLSHRKAWRRIVEQDLRAGLILEDDVELDLPVFRRGLDLALSDLRPTDVVKFPVTRTERIAGGPIARSRVSEPVVTPLGATSLIVGNRAARRFLDLTETFDRPIDTFMQMSWITGIRPCVVTPSGVAEISHRLGGSTIHVKSRPLLETLARNLLRPAYRLQVRAFSYVRGARPDAMKQASTTEVVREQCHLTRVPPEEAADDAKRRERQ